MPPASTDAAAAFRAGQSLEWPLVQSVRCRQSQHTHVSLRSAATSSGTAACDSMYLLSGAFEAMTYTAITKDAAWAL